MPACVHPAWQRHSHASTISCLHLLRAMPLRRCASALTVVRRHVYAVLLKQRNERQWLWWQSWWAPEISAGGAEITARLQQEQQGALALLRDFWRLETQGYVIPRLTLGGVEVGRSTFENVRVAGLLPR